jgi:hypothetical protein
MNIKTRPILIILVLLCLAAVGPNVQAVVPAPDGGYPGGNTAEGQNALLSLTTGTYNTAVGWLSLGSNTTGPFNTAIGAGALFANTTAESNTATGTGALFSHTTGNANTATGTFALFSDTTGQVNTATGASALFSNTSGSFNTANGLSALGANTTGGDNTANGAQALASNVGGNENTAVGVNALVTNTSGNNNTALGRSAGSNQTTGSDNIYIGFNIGGVPGESNACYIASIFGQTSSLGIPVLINADHKLGTITSSKRFKEDVKAMGTISEALFSLEPVTFRYKKEIDPAGTSQLGLVAEDVEKVNPQLVVRDKEGKPYSVRYDQVNAMLLNEFLKAHRKVQELEATVAQQQKNFQARFAEQQKQIEALASGLQKVSAQVEESKPERQVAANNP